MRSVKSILTVAVATASVIGATTTVQAQEERPLYRDVRQIHMIDNMSAVVTTPRGNYLVRFRNICQVQERGEFFVLDRFQVDQHVSQGDNFETSGTATPCTVESVTPMHAAFEGE